jgi:hypothetical protein
MLDQLRNAALALSSRRGLREQHPNEPWLWREDWAARAVQDASGFGATGCTWAFGLLWMMMCTPVVLAFVFTSRYDDPKLWFVLLFPLIGLAILGAALYMTLRRRKYGVSVCHLDHLPIAIGQTFRAQVEMRVAEIPESGFHVRLVSSRRVVRSRGSRQSIDETVLWSDETTVGRGAAAVTPNGVRVPVAFAIPWQSEPADERNAGDRVIWRLHVQAEVPGIDYAATFELPVFRTGEAPSFPTSGMTAVPQPSPDSGVTIGDEEILVRGQLHLGQLFAWIAFEALWFGFVAFLWRSGGPKPFLSIFLVVGGFVALAALDFLIGRTRIQASRAELRIRRSWFGLGRTRTIDLAQIESVTTRVGSSSGGTSYYHVIAQLRDGRMVKIAKNIHQKMNAESVAGRVRRQLGM